MYQPLFILTRLQIYTGEIPLGDCFYNFINQVVENNTRPKRPKHVPALTDEIWGVAESCWVKDPSKRPKTSELCETIHLILKQAPLQRHQVGGLQLNQSIHTQSPAPSPQLLPNSSQNSATSSHTPFTFNDHPPSSPLSPSPGIASNGSGYTHTLIGSSSPPSTSIMSSDSIPIIPLYQDQNAIFVRID